jgi:hypothetical protein
MSQEWFWTDEWQEKERDADEDIRLERVDEFDSVDDLILFLDELRDAE